MNMDQNFHFLFFCHIHFLDRASLPAKFYFDKPNKEKALSTSILFYALLWLQHPLYRFKDNLFFIALELFWESICVFADIKMSPYNMMNIK